MASTSIEWATDSWNPIAAYDRETGKRGWFCEKVSPGCTNCYAEQWNRFRGNGHLYRVGNRDKVRFELAPTLSDPLHWRKPRRVFVNSMTDLFFEEHTDEMIHRVYGVMVGAYRHQFLILTKRAERMRDFAGAHGTPPNVWLGVSVENQEQADLRIPLLLQTPAAIRFLSCEPLLGPVNLVPYLSPSIAVNVWDDGFGRPRREPGVDWVIVGGESGAGARTCHLAWFRDIAEQCHNASVPLFVKQLGATAVDWEADGIVGVDLADPKGGDPKEWPTELRVRQYPKVAVPA